MLEILLGIGIGLAIETTGLSLYIIYKRHINKPKISLYDIPPNRLFTDDIQQSTNSVDYTDL